jgi:hypothetical protein
MGEPELQSSTLKELCYPETSAASTGTTDFQRNPLIYAVKALELHFAEQAEVYISSNLSVYYVENEPSKAIAPDVFVVFGVPKYSRSLYKVWEEGKGPDVIIEIVPSSLCNTSETDTTDIYRELGVREYFQYDPLGRYLTPALQGRQLDLSGNYHPIPTSNQHESDRVLRVPSRLLGLELHLEDGSLRIFNPVNGNYLLSYEEAEQGRMLAEARTRAEAQARLQAEKARLQAEARSKAEAEARSREAESRRKGEARYKTEIQAHRQTEEARKQAEEARKQAEEARKQAEEARRQAEEARRQAEERLKTEVDARRQVQDALRHAEEYTKIEFLARRQVEDVLRRTEEQLKLEVQARRQVEEAHRQVEKRIEKEVAVRRQMEDALRQSEEYIKIEFLARKQAEENLRQSEERIKALEAEMQRMREQGE